MFPASADVLFVAHRLKDVESGGLQIKQILSPMMLLLFMDFNTNNIAVVHGQTQQSSKNWKYHLQIEMHISGYEGSEQ